MITAEQTVVDGITEDSAAQDLGPFFENPYGDKYLFSVNYGTFAKMRMEDVYADFFGKDYFEEDGLYLFVGTDSGLLIRYICETELPRGVKVAFVELPEVLQRLPEVVDLKTLPDNMCVATLETLGDCLSQFNCREYIYTNKAFSQRTLCAMDAHISAYVELYMEVQAAMQHAKWVTMLNLGEHSFIQKQLENLAENRVSADCLKNIFVGKTAVVLGVGPSLDEIIPWVKRNRNNLAVVAVSRASRRLLEAGLEPDIIVTIDPSLLSFDVSREMLTFSEKPLLVHGHHISPQLLAQWKNRSVYMGHRFPWSTSLNVETFPLYGPTVTQTALSVAMKLGVSQIVLGGVDLCFSVDGQVYGKTTQGRERGVRLGEVPGGIETNGGWRAETDFVFAHGVKITGGLAGEALSMGCRIVSMALGAAKIPNVEYLPVEEIQLDPVETSLGEIIAGIVPAESSTDRCHHYDLMLNEVNRARRAFLEIERLSVKAIKLNDALFRRKNKIARKGQLDAIEEKLNTEFAEFARFAKGYGALKFLRIVRPGRTEWDNYEDAKEAVQIYYESYRDISRKLLKIIEGTKKRIEMRLLEEEERPDFSVIFKYWTEELLFGRHEVVEKYRPGVLEGILEPEAKSLEALKSRFSAIMAREENLSPDSEPEEKDYKDLRGKAQVFFIRKAKDSLRILADSVKDDETEKGRAVFSLAMGYLKELEEESREALDYYNEIVEGNQVFTLEKALTRVASISFALGDNENLSLAFECLANISPMYMTKYADLLWLKGGVEQALEIYLTYLNRVPSDLLSMMKLGRYYLAAGSVEGGKMAYEYVLEKDPANRTAQQMLKELSLAAAQG